VRRRAESCRKRQLLVGLARPPPARRALRVRAPPPLGGRFPPSARQLRASGTLSSGPRLARRRAAGGPARARAAGRRGPSLPNRRSGDGRPTRAAAPRAGAAGAPRRRRSGAAPRLSRRGAPSLGRGAPPRSAACSDGRRGATRRPGSGRALREDAPRGAPAPAAPGASRAPGAQAHGRAAAAPALWSESSAGTRTRRPPTRRASRGTRARLTQAPVRPRWPGARRVARAPPQLL